MFLQSALRLQASKAVLVLNNLHERKFEKRLILTGISSDCGTDIRIAEVLIRKWT